MKFWYVSCVLNVNRYSVALHRKLYLPIMQKHRLQQSNTLACSCVVQTNCVSFYVWCIEIHLNKVAINYRGIEYLVMGSIITKLILYCIKVIEEVKVRGNYYHTWQVLDILSIVLVQNLHFNTTQCHFFDILFEGIHSWSAQWCRTSQS